MDLSGVKWATRASLWAWMLYMGYYHHRYVRPDAWPTMALKKRLTLWAVRVCLRLGILPRP